MFYSLINKISEVKFVPGASDFRIFRRPMVDSILDMNEYYRFSKGIFSWVGFNTYYIPYEADARANGTTKWSFIKLFKYAIEGIVSFTTTPLRMATILGIIVSLLSFIYLVMTIIQIMIFGIDVPGYASTLGMVLLLGGIQLLSLGIIGEYLARTYVETK
jgi:glycosyltransferase involved in cell wall biosynthesis